MKPYKCDLCPKAFQSRNDLDRHLAKIHRMEHIGGLAWSYLSKKEAKI